MRRIPEYAIWDDHDFGPDNSDSTLKGKEDSLRAFIEHWANPAYGEKDNPGVYFKFTRNDVDFFMLDDRLYRTPNNAKDDGHKTMLGRKQVEWLKRELLASQAPIKIIAAGGEWELHGTDDSWSSFQRERDEIFDWIESNQMHGVLLLSGDRHFTAAYQVKGKWIEVTAGPLGSANAKSKVLPEMFSYHDKGKMYCVYDLDTRPGEPRVTLEVYQAGDGLVERRVFSWAEVLGQTKIKLLSTFPEKTTSNQAKSPTP
jgi:alkaline phosphatase D